MALQLVELDPDVIKWGIKAAYHQIINNWIVRYERENLKFTILEERYNLFPKANII